MTFLVEGLVLLLDFKYRYYTHTIHAISNPISLNLISNKLFNKTKAEVDQSRLIWQEKLIFQRSCIMSSTLNVMVTFYGWPDNDPPSDIIAYPKSDYPSCVHNHAGGNGTYEDPITVAVITKDNGGNWEPGTRMYLKGFASSRSKISLYLNLPIS